jgi:glucosamine--fructose-6-phosphate aminotransferase (isomerizing)
MCGIVGYVGDLKAAEYVYEGLRSLEYRGYDSAGIATVHAGEMHLRRRKGKLSVLGDLLREEPLQGNLAIGHTRWATHGKPSNENAHPHHVDDVVVVHNGIIENFYELRHRLADEGCVFESETDTEIIAHLVARVQDGDLESRVRKALEQVVGAYAIAAISTKSPDTIVVAKNASPLVIGVKDDAGLIASDIPALLPHTRDVLFLDENEMATLQPGSISITKIDSGEKVEREPRTIDWSPVMAEKGGHRHFMHKEMFEQPRALADTIRGRINVESDGVDFADAVLEIPESVKRVIFTACGTSWHASQIGRLALEEFARMGCEVELASELRYRKPLLGPETLIVAVSQSGETADTLAAIKEAKACGSPVSAIVNVVDSSIARAADSVLYTRAGPEIGVASTKAFLTQLAALYLFAIGVGRQRGMPDEKAHAILMELQKTPRLVEACLHEEEKIKDIAHRFARVHSSLFLGRGYGYPVALEGALKLKEISYIHAEGYAAGEMKHGPIALIEQGLPVVVIAPKDELYDKVIANMQEVRAREGYVIALANEGDEHVHNFADDVIYIPETLPQLMPLVASVPLQLLAYHVADLRGTDIDQPRNLAKSVTVE